VDWFSLIAGAVVGAVVGVLVQNIAFPRLAEWTSTRRRLRFYAAVNDAWSSVDQIQSDIRLVQAGWADGYFAPGTAEMRLDGDFELTDPSLLHIRAAHTDEWLGQKRTDDEQVGISSFIAVRISDDPADELNGRAHHLQLVTHTYRYFDYLATHDLLRECTDAERAALTAVVGTPRADVPVRGFPNPCSVGLSLFCEAGAYLVLTMRSKHNAGGKYLEDKIFNAVGEMAAPWDFTVDLDGSRHATPDEVARRGLHQEAGFSGDDLQSCSKIGVHSFAWSSELLDHKFFGLAVTPLSRGEVEYRLRSAKDFLAESTGVQFYPVETHQDCVVLLRLITQQRLDWSPEAVFSTIRSLLVLRRLRPSDLVNTFAERRTEASEQPSGFQVNKNVAMPNILPRDKERL